jgi:hypothetical protein
MNKAKTLVARAQLKLLELNQRRAEPAFVRVLGRFVAEGWLLFNQPIEQHHEPIALADALRAGETEPRILELLPTLVLRRPATFIDIEPMPEDLRQVVHRLRRGAIPEGFRGIPGENIFRWLTTLARSPKPLRVLRSFRFSAEDSRLLTALSKQHGVSETEVVRRGLRALTRDAPPAD